jgi:hypothetical protein
MLTITEFLLTYAATAEPVGEAGHTDTVFALNARPALHGRALREEVERHHDRTMTITSHAGIETMTRCGVCPKSEPPCIGLRRLALPYAHHPAYRPEWRV